MNHQEIKSLLLTAVQSGENFKLNGMSDTYLTREMFQPLLDMHGVSDEAFNKCMNELLEQGVVRLDDELYYRVNSP